MYHISVLNDTILHSFIISFTVYIQQTSPVCIGEEIRFTCVSDTNSLYWRNINNVLLFYDDSDDVDDPPSSFDIFIINLVLYNGSYVSFATVSTVTLNNDGRQITCLDAASGGDEVTVTVNVAGK